MSLEDTIGENLHELDKGREELANINHKRKHIGTFDSFEIKNAFSSKYMIEEKTNHKVGEEYSQHITDKELVCSIRTFIKKRQSTKNM